jgi:hypothetical protein
MRIVKREFSTRILLPWERHELLDHVPLYRRVSVRGGKSKRLQNPFLTAFLAERYKIYKRQLSYDQDKDTYTIDEDAYKLAVGQWYVSNGFVSAESGQPLTWAAYRHFEDMKQKLDPTDIWAETPRGAKKAKSHHPISEEGKRREREQRKEHLLKKRNG